MIDASTSAARHPGFVRWWMRWPAALLSGRAIVAFWLGYGLCHGAIRLAASGSLSLDDARASELTQTFALGYQLRQPPLYEWLLWSLQQVLGTGIASHLTLRYALIAGIGIATYGATRALTNDSRWAAAASLSLLLTYPVGWTFHEWATQTLLLSIACIVTLHAELVFLRRPSPLAAVALGLAVGLGLMSKFSYLLYLGGLVLAVASLPGLRGRLADRRLLLSGAIALSCAAPFLWWLVTVRADLAGMATALLVQSPQPHAVRALIGLGKLVWALPAFLLPWLAIVVLVAWPAFLHRSPPADDGERLALRAMAFAAVLAAVGIAAIGATNIAERYMHPVLMTAPVYLFARIARVAPEEDRLRWIAATALLAAAVLLVIRLASFTENDLTRRSFRGFAIPYDGLAQALRERGITAGTVVAPRVREAGNLRAFLPQLRVIGGDSYRAARPPRRGGARACVLIWRETDIAAARRSYAPEHIAAGERIAVSRSGIFGMRRGVWYLVRLDPGAQICS
jgi:hypothetical protein